MTQNRKVNNDLQNTNAFKFNFGSLVRKNEVAELRELEDTYSKYTVLEPEDIVINGLNLNYDFVSYRVAKATEKGIITSAYIVLTLRKVITHPIIHCCSSLWIIKSFFMGWAKG